MARCHNKLAGFVFVVAATLIGVASTAWACGVGMGWIKITSTTTFTSSYADMNGQTTTGSGAAGSIIKVTAGALKIKPAKYKLVIAPPGSGIGCHEATQVMSSPTNVALVKMTTNSGGKLDKDLAATGIQAYKAKIPTGTPSGNATICGREVSPTPGDTYTGHATFTIT